MSYAECLKKYYNAVDGTFYDAINLYQRVRGVSPHFLFIPNVRKKEVNYGKNQIDP